MGNEDKKINELIQKNAEKYGISENLETQKRIKKEITRLKKLFKEIDKNKIQLVNSTIEDVAFLTISMQDLRENIIRDGTTVTYKNGENQYGVKQNPDAQLYLQMSQKHTQSVKILLDCMPKTLQPAIKDDGFMDFVIGRDVD